MDVIDSISVVLISVGFSFITAYSTARYMISIDHRKQAIPFTIRFRDECSEIVGRATNSKTLFEAKSDKEGKIAQDVKVELINQADHLLRKNLASYRPYLSKQLVQVVDDLSSSYLSLLEKVAEMNIYASGRGEYASEAEIQMKFSQTSDELLNDVFEKAAYSLIEIEVAVNKWLEDNG